MKRKINCDPDCSNVNCVGGVITRDGSSGVLCTKCNPPVKNDKKYDNEREIYADIIKRLKDDIIKRDELIYTMILTNSFGYQRFMAEEDFGIDELRDAFKVIENTNSKVAKRRIALLHHDLNN